MKEIWKKIDGYPYNEASNLGRIKSLDKPVKNGYGTISVKKGQILKNHTYPNKYQSVTITYPDGKRRTTWVHRLVALAFIDNPENKKTVNHIDKNPSNNLETNLEWATLSENCKHRDIGVDKIGMGNNCKQLIALNILNGEELFFLSIGECSLKLNTSKSNVQRSLKLGYKLLRKYKLYEKN